MEAKRRKKRRVKLVASKEEPKTTLTRRLTFLLLPFSVVLIYLLVMMFIVVFIDGPEKRENAVTQWTRTTTVSAARGEILDINGKLLAANTSAYKVVLWPKRIDDNDNERVSTELSKLLGLSYDYVYTRVSNDNMWEITLKRQIDSATRDAVEALKLGKGVGTAVDYKRYYPNNSLLSQVLGFTNVDGAGQTGLELSLNEYLSGTDGKKVTETDSSGNPLAYGQTDYVEPIDGLDITLTCDAVIQSYLENRLLEAAEINNAKRAVGIIMDCNTGAILAMGSSPDYDLNQPPRNDMDLLNELSRNYAVTDVYEPGSTFKILTLAAAIDSGAADMGSSFSCSGSYLVNGEVIHCWRHAGHGNQNLTQAAENSCNCAFMRMALTVGKERLYDYLYAFGLGKSTGSGLLGEASGIVTHEKYVTDNDLARIGFGQSIAVTPLQLVTAVSAAVNGGYLHQPYIIERMTDKKGDITFSANTEPIRQVISESTSAKVRNILRSVVDNGTGRNCQIEGYAVGGKTGTAQKYDEYGRVAEGKYICSFIGFAPADNPRFVCLILVDEPQVSQIFGSTVAAPFVKAVLEDVLHYKEILPTQSRETVVVPDVVGLSAHEAEEKLAELGLTAVLESEDEVTAQVPAAGETVVKGFQVLLYTGVIVEETEADDGNTMYVNVPNLKGMTPLEAYDALTKLGLIMVTETDDPSGVVYSQSVSPNTAVAVGYRVEVKFRDKSLND